MIYVIAIALAATIIITIVSNIQSNRKMKAQIISNFGKTPQENDVDFKSIGRYAERMNKDNLRIDNITWGDLDMDRVFQRINSCQSSVGEEYLYNTLQQPLFDEVALLKREQLIDFFDKHPEERVAAQIALARLGKSNYNGLTSLIFDTDFKLLSNAWIYKLFAVLPLVAAIGFVFSIPIGLAGIFLSFIVNSIVHYRTKKSINTELPAIAYFTSTMQCCKKLLKIETMKTLPVITGLKTSFGIFKKVASKSPTAKSMPSGDISEAFAEALWVYFSITFLYEIRHYNNFMRVVLDNNDDFHTIYKTIGEIELAIAVLSFRKSLQAFVTPTFSNENAMDFEDIFHPLIQNPVTNTHRIANDSLITGSNASGKSTFIKTLAINGILAQTIFTCTAAKFATRFSLVVTSMAMRDNLQGGESYFIVEIKSLKRILDLVKEYPCTCYVDEILRGTNTVERVAASASVLSYLQKQDCLCIAASHDIELTQILDKYDNYNFCEQVTDNDITFDYKLKKGPSTSRNAIKLLSVMGFDNEIVMDAEANAYSATNGKLE